jgi:hypothetical protein
MATWKGKPHTYTLEVVGDHGYLDYGKVEYKWEYGTCADSLVIIRTEEGKEPIREYFGRDYAIAQMETLLDWFSTYEGMENLEAIISAIKESKK